MTSFLFVVKIPISEDDKSSSPSDKKSDSDNDSAPKKDESDDEGGQVSKDADSDGDDSDTETSNSGNQKDKSEKKKEGEGWDFGEGEPEKGADLTKSGVENDGVVITTVTQNKTQPETKTNGTSVKNQVHTETTNVIQTNATQGLENTENSKSNSQNTADPAKTTRPNTDTGKCNGNNNITIGEEESVKTAGSTEGSDVDGMEVGIIRENTEAKPPPKKTFTVEKAQENSLPAGTTEGSDVASLDGVEVGIVGENREASKSPPKKTFTVEKAKENSLPLSDVNEKQNQLEGIVEHLEKSQSVPPGKLHDELPMPKSLSDDRISEIEKAEGQMVKFIEDEPLIEVPRSKLL